MKKAAFLQISADFETGFENFCSSSGSGDIREKLKFQNQLDVFFLLLTVRLSGG